MDKEAELNSKMAALEARIDALAGSNPTGVDDRLARVLKYMPLLFIANLLVGAPALLISLVIAYATFTQAEATTKIQQAEAWPFISYGTSNASEDNERVISLVLSNNGIGPALLGPMEIRYKGSPVRTPKELLARCCGYREGTPLTFATSPSSNVVVRPGETTSFLRVPAAPPNERVWNIFNDERWKLEVRSCYCSVFGECWIVKGAQTRPRAVDQCPTNWVAYSEGTPVDQKNSHPSLSTAS
jgi:hypothetical protein